MKRTRIGAMLGGVVATLVAVAGFTTTSQAAVATTAARNTSAARGSICVAYNESESITNLPELIAFQALNKAGILKVHVVVYASVPLQVAAIASGRCDIGLDGSYGSVIAADVAGAKLKAIGVDTDDSQVLVSKKSITSISQLKNGAVFGSFGPAEYSTAFGIFTGKKYHFTPQIVYDGGTSSRAVQLVANRIDFTSIDLASVADLDAQGEANDFNILAYLSKLFPNFVTNTIFTNANYVSSHKALVTELMNALISSYRKNGGDAKVLEAAGRKYVTGWSAQNNKEVAIYLSHHVWVSDQKAYLNPAAARYTAMFYKAVGVVTSVPKNVNSYLDMEFIQSSAG